MFSTRVQSLSWSCARKLRHLDSAIRRRMATGSQPMSDLLILDFEATCDKERQPEPQEIIEFPCLRLNAQTRKIESTFHSYIRPHFNPTLTPFCSELTGILQVNTPINHQSVLWGKEANINSILAATTGDMGNGALFQDFVEDEPEFPEILGKFEAWLKTEGLLDETLQLRPGAAFVTCGDWDLNTMIGKQCRASGMEVPRYFQQWINLKKIFFNETRTWPKGMMQMLKHTGITHKGRHHSGIDDSKNIAELAIWLMNKGAHFHLTGSLSSK